MHRRIDTAGVVGPSHAREEKVPLGLHTRSGTLGAKPPLGYIGRRDKARNTCSNTTYIMHYTGE